MFYKMQPRLDIYVLIDVHRKISGTKWHDFEDFFVPLQRENNFTHF